MTAIDSAIYAMGPIFAGPSADGTNGQVLVTNGSKQLSFTTIVSGVTALNSLTGSLSIAVGTSGSDVAVSASGSTVTVNIPDAGASARGVLTTGTQTIAGAKTFSGAVSFGGLVSTTAFGIHDFSAFGTGEQILKVGNKTAGTGNYGGFRIVNDNTNMLTALAMSSTFTTSGGYVQASGVIDCQGSGGLTIAADHASGVTRFYAGGIGSGNEQMRVTTTGLVVGTTTPVTGFKLAVSGSVTVTGGVSVGPVTFSVLNATTATATLGVYRITDRANRLAYPDGTNWRFVSDDAIIS